ncbi:MAG: cytidine deaminase [Acholeplasmatales bacterium]|jgi:cytidine deaminase|nr:cytidine deaminase [Acholeplasmataceae bacterium]MDY0115065.1 cytidine deaminase [Acholeplasmatales bacterium]MCK9289183.1 cytidine deaminase [Acholeplasmataceae bacterium]MCK9427053.1 cytidine deaminase [Acholeplasmataceae bacterium]MDD4090544.1 cytidine deaminase [Acholeplasmataceae bacterium]
MELIKEAIKAREKAYVPYSNFKVGAAILLKDGQVIHGANIENASYGLSNCAERSVLFSFYSQGYQKEDIKAMAVVGDTEEPISPCGACRQVMNELLPKETPIYLANLKGKQKKTLVTELLPYSFNKIEL